MSQDTISLIIFIVVLLLVSISIAAIAFLLRTISVNEFSKPPSQLNASYIGGRKPAKTGVRKNLKQNPRSKSEAAVIKILESLTGKKFPTVNPDWLIYDDADREKIKQQVDINGPTAPPMHPRTLELDGYNQELKLALEFSGPLHTRWIQPASANHTESYEAYFERVLKDRFKLAKCAEHGVNLIVIDMSLPRRHWKNYLKSRLSDLNLCEIDAELYIQPRVAEPFLRVSSELDTQ